VYIENYKFLLSAGFLCDDVSLMSNGGKYLTANTFCDKQCTYEETPFWRRECCGVIKQPSLGLVSSDSHILIEKQGKNKIILRYNNMYLSVKKDGTAGFTATVPQDDGVLFVEKISNDTIALKSIYNKYLTAKACRGYSDRHNLLNPTFTSFFRESPEMWKVKCLTKKG
jgi:hypothetical protein